VAGARQEEGRPGVIPHPSHARHDPDAAWRAACSFPPTCGFPSGTSAGPCWVRARLATATMADLTEQLLLVSPPTWSACRWAAWSPRPLACGSRSRALLTRISTTQGLTHAGRRVTRRWWLGLTARSHRCRHRRAGGQLRSRGGRQPGWVPRAGRPSRMTATSSPPTSPGAPTRQPPRPRRRPASTSSPASGPDAGGARHRGPGLPSDHADALAAGIPEATLPGGRAWATSNLRSWSRS
jgi:hypothetical protein